LVARQVAVIATGGATAAALAAKAATSTIPIVFVVGGDPVKFGLVASLNRPGGNVTGVSFLANVLMAKRLEFLRELVPTASVIGVLVNPNNPNADSDTKDVRAAAVSLGRQIHVVHAGTEGDLNAAFASLVEQRAAALMVFPDALFVSLRERLADPGRRSQAARDLYEPRVRRGWWADELRKRPDRCVSRSRYLHRPNSQGRKAFRPAGGAVG
jgi:putative ABC transport system substrate-binding protein